MQTLSLLLLSPVLSAVSPAYNAYKYDAVVYDATSGGVTAATSAARNG